MYPTDIMISVHPRHRGGYAGWIRIKEEEIAAVNGRNIIGVLDALADCLWEYMAEYDGRPGLGRSVS